MHKHSNTFLSFSLYYRWSIFAKNLPGRTDNEIKNYWHTHLKKRTQGQNLILPSSQVKVESSCQTSLVLKEEINQESSQSDNNHHQISNLGLCHGLTSPSASCCSVLSQSYYDAPSHQESSANFWNQQLNIEDYELAVQGSSCSEFSFGCTSDDSNISNLMTAVDHTTISPTYECFDDFWSQPFETDYMVNNSYKHQQPFVDPLNPSSDPITDEVFLWSYI